MGACKTHVYWAKVHFIHLVGGFGRHFRSASLSLYQQEETKMDTMLTGHYERRQPPKS